MCYLHSNTQIVKGKMNPEKIKNWIYENYPALKKTAKTEPKFDDFAQTLSDLTAKISSEIAENVKNINADELKLVEIIKQSSMDNKQEKLQIQEVNFRNYLTVLQNYLKMKLNPEDFEDVERRLSDGKATIVKFDEDLTVLIKLNNEEKMTEFEVALRQMGK